MTFISMAAGGAAKTLFAVTISLHPGTAQAAGHYTVVQHGDSLSAISEHEYGTAADWPALWWANRQQVPDPSLILPGQRLLVPGDPQVGPWLIRAAQGAMAGSRPAAVRAAAPRRHRAWVTSTPARAAVAAQPAMSYRGAPGSFQACVIQRESSGNPAAVNPSSGAGGLYGFLPSTWHALGFSGLPENAPVSVQNAAFAKEYAQSGTSAWAPYDGC
ncbi:MAG: transglycosylase family protein [Streptosporangiales bacterium]